MTRTILLAAAMLAALAGNAAAATYYVDCESTSASDSHTSEEAQTEDKPWKTLRKGVDTAEPGDTVLVKGSECPDPQDTAVNTELVLIQQDGTPTDGGAPKWTYFKAYPGHRPHIRFNPDKTGIHIHGSYIWIEGFEISPNNYNPGEIIGCPTGKGGWGIWSTQGHHHVIRNCNIHNCAPAGIGINWVDYVTIENNTIWNNAWWSNCGSSGIHIFQPLPNAINSGATTVNGIDYRIVVANNRIYGNDNKVNTYQQDRPTDGNGVALDDFGWKQPNSILPDQLNKLYPHRTLIMNNVIYGNGGRGILADAAHADVLHNTVYNNLQNQLLRASCPALAEIALGGFDMRVFNNIAAAQYNSALWLKYDYPFAGYPAGTEPKISYGNNLSYGGGTETDSGATDAGGNLTQDPLLAAPSLTGDADFHLQQSSPAINKGSVANSVPLDFDSLARPIGGIPDIGAYEAQSDFAKTVNPANGHSYQRFHTPATWSAAKAACVALGGHLATVTSKEEQDYIITKGAGAWLGGTDQTVEGAWQWLSGEQWNWTNWDSSEPNDMNGGEDFLHLWPNGTWNDNGGPGDGKDAAMPYICEWENKSSSNAWLPVLYKLLLDGK